METYFCKCFPLLCNIDMALKNHAQNKFPKSFLWIEKIHNLQ
jgi:hypothetical protein